MAALAISSPGSSVSISLASWERPVKCGKIVRIRTIKVDEFPTVLKILQVWKNIYEDIPKYVSEGRSINMYCKTGKNSQVLLAENSRGVAEAFVRVERSFKGLMIEELLVAPWNNTPCIKYTKGLDWILAHSRIKELTDLHKVDPKDLVEYKPYTGTLLMYGVCLYANDLKIENLDLFSLRRARDFYTKLGLKEAREMFTWRMADGLPLGLFERMLRNFPGELIRRAYPLKC